MKKTFLGFLPAHFRAWANVMDEERGYESQLTQFLKRLAGAVDMGEVNELACCECGTKLNYLEVYSHLDKGMLRYPLCADCFFKLSEEGE